MPENKAPKYIITAIVAVTIAILGFIFWYSKRAPEKTAPEIKPSMQQVLESLTAPERPVSPAIDNKPVKSISAPKRTTPTKVDSKIINSLTAPTSSK